MPAFNPEQGHGWMLREAVMRTAIPTMLATVERCIQELAQQGVAIRFPDWWDARLAPTERDASTQGDRDLGLIAQHLIGTVEADFRDKLYTGALACWGRPGASLAPYTRAPVWAIVAIECWWRGGGIVCLEDGAKLYAARVEPPANRIISEAELKDWIRRHPDLSEAKALAAARAELGGEISRDRFRELQAELGFRRKAGRPAKQ
jgi:hypothetical protein